MTERDYQGLASFRYHIRRFLRFSEDAAHSEGLESQQHQFLLAVRAESQADGPTIGHIAERLMIQHHSAVGLADRLAERGLLERARSVADRRQVRLRLTPEGAAILTRLSERHRQELHESGPQLVAALQLLLKGVSSESDGEVLEVVDRNS